MVNMPGLCSMDILSIAFEGTHEDMVVLGAFWEIPQFRRGDYIRGTIWDPCWLWGNGPAL